MTNRELLQIANTVKHNLELIQIASLSLNDNRYLSNAKVNTQKIINDLNEKTRGT